MPPTSDDDKTRFATRLADLEKAVATSKAYIADSLALLQRVRRVVHLPVKTDAAFAIFSAALDTQGVREAIAYLGSLTDYRFISIFRFHDGKATSVVHVDRDDPLAMQADEVPETATYCCYVRDGGGAFVTADAMLDARTAGHPKREALSSYCGVPIMDPEGGLIGTLCHYDVVARDPEQLDLPLLLRVSSRLAQSGLVPAYPTA